MTTELGHSTGGKELGNHTVVEHLDSEKTQNKQMNTETEWTTTVAGKLAEFIASQKGWLKEQAELKIAEADSKHVHPNVLKHWKLMAGQK